MNLGRDVAQEILTRVPYKVLLVFLASPKYKQLIENIGQFDSFWYERLAYQFGRYKLDSLRARPELKGVTIDHARVYFDVRLASEESDQQRRYLHGGSYLPSLLFIEEVYGEPHSDMDEGTQFWSYVKDGAVLNYSYYRSSYVNLHRSYDLRVVEVVLVTAARNDDIDLASATATLMKKHNLNIQDVKPFVFACMKGNKNMLTILYNLSNISMGEQVLKTVLRSRRLELWSVVREELLNHPHMPSELFSDLLEDGHTKALDFFFEVEPEIVHSLNWTGIATSDTCISSTRQLQYLLQKVGLSSPNNAILVAAASYLESFRVVLSDPDVDSMLEHEKVIRKALDTSDEFRTTSTDTEVVLSILLNHPLFRLEELGLPSVRMLSYGLHRIVRSRAEAVAVASSVHVLGRSWELGPEYQELSALLEGEDGTLTLIVRAVCFLDLDIDSLAHWMIKSGNMTIYRACHSIVKKYIPQDREERIIAGLLLFFVYSDMSLEEHILAREEEEMEETDILLLVQLIGLVLGDDISQRLD